MPQPTLWTDTARIDVQANPVRDAVAIYMLELDIPAPLALLPDYLAFLGSGDEARRALRPSQHQWQYLQSRVLRRVVLGAYIGCAPGELRFTRDQWGRSCLSDHGALHFSLAACASHAALAVSSAAALGIDVKTVFPVRPSFMQLARAHFGGADLAQLEACPPAMRYQHYLELWTLKQAYLKAIGSGKQPMTSCSFSRTSAGVLVCHDPTCPPERERPDAFLSQRWDSTCQLGLAHRAGLPLSYRYLNGNSVGHIWPHTQPGRGNAYAHWLGVPAMSA